MTTESHSSTVKADSKATPNVSGGDENVTAGADKDAAADASGQSVFSRFEKLRQAMEEVAEKARPQHIHALRTSSRRVMAALSLLDARVESELDARVTTPVMAGLTQLQTQVHQLQASGEALSLELARPLKKAQKSAEKLSAAFAHVRDLDVARSLITELNRELATEGDSDDPAISDLERWLKKRRKRLAEQASTWLSSRRVRRLRKRITRAAASVSALETSGERMAAMLDAAREELLAQLPALKGGSMDEKALHAARISARRLRYSLELWGNPASEKALEALQNLQELLGAHRDWSRLEDLMTARRSRLLQSERLPDVRHAMAALEPVLRRRVDSLALRFPTLADQLEHLLRALPLVAKDTAATPPAAGDVSAAHEDSASATAVTEATPVVAQTHEPAAPAASPSVPGPAPRKTKARSTPRAAAAKASAAASPTTASPATPAPAPTAAATTSAAKSSPSRKKPVPSTRAKAPAAPAPVAEPSPVAEAAVAAGAVAAGAVADAATTSPAKAPVAPRVTRPRAGKAQASDASAAEAVPARKPAATRKAKAPAASVTPPDAPVSAPVATKAPTRAAPRSRKASPSAPAVPATPIATTDAPPPAMPESLEG